MDVVVEHEPVGVVGDLGLVAELDRLAEPALETIGRASGSCSDTSRVAPSGLPPARRVRVCSTTLPVRSTSVSRSTMARASVPEPAAPCRRRVRLALEITRLASAAVVAASSANSPVMALTCSLAWPERRLRLAAIDRARRPADRDRSRVRVRVAPPAALTLLMVLPMRVMALASSPESVG